MMRTVTVTVVGFFHLTSGAAAVKHAPSFTFIQMLSWDWDNISAPIQDCQPEPEPRPDPGLIYPCHTGPIAFWEESNLAQGLMETWAGPSKSWTGLCLGLCTCEGHTLGVGGVAVQRRPEDGLSSDTVNSFFLQTEDTSFLLSWHQVDNRLKTERRRM